VTFVFSYIMVNFSKLFKKVISHVIRRIKPASSDWRLIKHSDMSTCFLKFVVLKCIIYHETIMFISFQERLFTSRLSIVKAYFHVVSISLYDIFVKLLILFTLLYLFVKWKDNNVVRIVLLGRMLVIQFDVFRHNWP